MHIFVGSTNPVKINAVVTAASETYPSVIVRGVDVVSGVSEQPRSDEETRLGAVTRARAAQEVGELMVKGGGLFHFEEFGEFDEETGQPKDQRVLGMGLEGGVFEFGDELWSTVWIAVVDGTGAVFESNGARFKVPDVVAEQIRAGGEMGPVMDELLSASNTKQGGGMISIITRGFVDRTEEYTGIAKMALGLWYGRRWDRLVR